MEKKGNIEIDNIIVNPEENFVCISVNPRLYKMHVIMNAADEFITEAEFMISGDPEKEITIKFIPKKKLTKEELIRLAYRFSTQLVSHSATR